MSDGPALIVFVCDGPTCGDQLDSARVHRHLVDRVRAQGLQDRVSIEHETCFGFCQRGPNMMFAPAVLVRGRAPLVGTPQTTIHHGVTPESSSDLLHRRLAGAPPVAAFDPRPAGGGSKS